VFESLLEEMDGLLPLPCAGEATGVFQIDVGIGFLNEFGGSGEIGSGSGIVPQADLGAGASDESRGMGRSLLQNFVEVRFGFGCFARVEQDQREEVGSVSVGTERTGQVNVSEGAGVFLVLAVKVGAFEEEFGVGLIVVDAGGEFLDTFVEIAVREGSEYSKKSDCKAVKEWPERSQYAAGGDQARRC